MRPLRPFCEAILSHLLHPVVKLRVVVDAACHRRARHECSCVFACMHRDLRIRGVVGNTQKGCLVQVYRTGYRWSPVRTLPVAPLWCDLGFCSRTVVVIKLRRTSAKQTLNPKSSRPLVASSNPTLNTARDLRSSALNGVAALRHCGLGCRPRSGVV